MTTLESSTHVNTMDLLTVFAELKKFETRVEASKTERVNAPTEKMKNIALYSTVSKLESNEDSESDEVMALMSTKIVVLKIKI